jgi:hypothetical protein
MKTKPLLTHQPTTATHENRSTPAAHRLHMQHSRESLGLLIPNKSLLQPPASEVIRLYILALDIKQYRGSQRNSHHQRPFLTSITEEFLTNFNLLFKNKLLKSLCALVGDF